jgi:putative tryptophan/tyrosine transport system substrate-binding protein
MRRREFIAIVAGAVWPFAARARQSGAVAKIGFLYPGPETVAKSRSTSLLAGLASEALREPDQVAVLVRATGGDATQITPLLNELLAS